MAPTPAQKVKTGHRNLYDDPCLSDVKVKFGGQQIHAHKVVLSTKCEYFYKAFTGGFPVAKSDEVDLGDDDDADAVRAAIRHLYDRPYDMIIDEDELNPGNGTTNDDLLFHIRQLYDRPYDMIIDEDELNPGSGTTNDDLLFHIHVFAVADKYDIPTLRSLVVNKFKHLMETSWEGPQFAPAMKAVCLPSAPKLADGSLQQAAAEFCAEHVEELVKQEGFNEVLEEEEPFAGRLLTLALAKAHHKSANLLICNICRALITACDRLNKQCHSCYNRIGYNSSWDVGTIRQMLDKGPTPSFVPQYD